MAGQVSKLLQLEKSGSSVCEMPSPGRVTRSMHLIPRFNPPTEVGGLQITPVGHVRLATKKESKQKTLHSQEDRIQRDILQS